VLALQAEAEQIEAEQGTRASYRHPGRTVGTRRTEADENGAEEETVPDTAEPRN
jgi:hypothetical protein